MEQIKTLFEFHVCGLSDLQSAGLGNASICALARLVCAQAMRGSTSSLASGLQPRST
jgi:hypothetical protein